MTITLPPRPTDRKRTEPLRSGPYYGHALRRVLDPPPSRIERLTAWYNAHPMLAVVMVVFGALVAAFTLAAWIVL